MTTPDPNRDPKVLRLSRRTFFTTFARGAVIAVVGGGAAALAALKLRGGRGGKSRTVWQIDPWKCTQCGRCRTECVLAESAAKCVHDLSMCGYCKPCFGYFQPTMVKLEPGPGNEMCPYGAIARQPVEEPYYQYTIDEKRCTACGLCVKGCSSFGNGSLYLQVRHDRCLNCNECSIAAACPSDALIRLPADRPYIIKSKGPEQI